MVRIHFGDALDAYQDWAAPTVIISDGPYGISGYPGDARRPELLAGIYAPHIAAWSKAATPRTTLWFWGTEVGWASVHPVLQGHGWSYRGCNIWDKGVGHIAGNCNGKTMRKFPTVTEICAHYVRDAEFVVGSRKLGLQDWFRSEWRRTGLPLSKANEACGVRNAATRKYLTADHVWYAPPPEVFAKLASYANEHGLASGRPYFDVDPADMTDKGRLASKWEKMQAKFRFEYGATNVWTQPANRGSERLKIGGRAVHNNQKPEALIARIVAASSDAGDVVWDPFCGTGSVALTARRMGREVYAAELNREYFDLASARCA